MAFTIWRFTDGKAGHDSQSKGLCAAIEKQITCNQFDIPIDSFFNSLGHFIFKRFPAGTDLPDPNIMIGAGHGTHLPMLSARHARKGKIIVLMKPSLPLSFFDICIIPKHDLPPDKDNVITTIGALNPVQFNNNKQTNRGLILLGGPSKHYQWDNKSIAKQVNEIVANAPEVQWTIADSPRTPKETLTIMLEQAYDNVDLLSHLETETKRIHEIIFNANIIWVSRDSVSMIYESLSSGASVGLLDVQQTRKTRVSNAIEELIFNGQITTFKKWKKSKLFQANTIKLNEADRCSLFLLERGFLS